MRQMTPSTVASCCCGICAAVLTTGEVAGGLGAAMRRLRELKAAGGWGHDERGRVRCPICLGEPAERAGERIRLSVRPDQVTSGQDVIAAGDGAIPGRTASAFEAHDL